MTLFKEIKRRARNVVLALAGKGAGWQEKLEPVQIKVGPSVKVETFAAERFVENIDEFMKPEMMVDCYRKQLAAKIAGDLLAAGCFEEEMGERPHELGLRGTTLRLTLRVLRPEEEAE